MKHLRFPGILPAELEPTRLSELGSFLQLARPIPCTDLLRVACEGQEGIGYPSAFRSAAYNEQLVPGCEELAMKGLGIKVHGDAIDILGNGHHPLGGCTVTAKRVGQRIVDHIGILIGRFQITLNRPLITNRQGSLIKCSRIFELLVGEGRKFLNSPRNGTAYSKETRHILCPCREGKEYKQEVEYIFHNLMIFRVITLPSTLALQIYSPAGRVERVSCTSEVLA